MSDHKHYLQIDLLKGLAILFVIIGHTIPFSTVQSLILIQFIFVLTIDQAVPIFLILMGRNMASSFKNRGYSTLKQIFNKNYFKKRFRRIILPLIIAFYFSAFIGMILNKTLYFGLYSLIGLLPMSGPGNYFISLVFEFIIIFPLIYIAFIKHPKITLISCLLINLVFELIAQQYIPTGSYLDGATIFRVLFLICLGIFLLDYDIKKSIFRDKLIIIGTIIISAYLIISFFLGWISSYFISTTQYTNIITVFYPLTSVFLVLTAFYPLMLVVLGLRYLPEKSNFIPFNLLATIGKASYHIFLVQIIFFGAGFSLIENPLFTTPKTILTYLNNSDYINSFLIILVAVLFNVVVCVILGLLFYFLTEQTGKLFNYRKKKN